MRHFDLQWDVCDVLFVRKITFPLNFQSWKSDFVVTAQQQIYKVHFSRSSSEIKLL